MRTMTRTRTIPAGDAVLAASRQVWLASLGAAVVSREWAQAEAGNVFRTLVKEGTAVESKAIRLVGDGIEVSFTRANAAWRQTRSTVEATVRQLADTAVTLAQKKIPRALPKVRLPAMLNTAPKAKVPRAAKKAAAKTKRVVKTRSTKAVKRVKSTVKAATKR
jgi:hypothetical protein